MYGHDPLRSDTENYFGCDLIFCRNANVFVH